MGLYYDGCFAKPITMKTTLVVFCCFASLFIKAQLPQQPQNIFIITTDGFRWQEVFNGADGNIVGNPKYVADTALLKAIYWDDDTAMRRNKLMPFFWNVIAKKGQLYGNRNYGNKMNVSNIYKFSYPGYNEIFTGYADLKFVPNKPVPNRNTNILEYLNAQDAYKGKVVAFASWNILPFILNEDRSKFEVNGGYEAIKDADSNAVFRLINQIEEGVAEKAATRYDELTYLSAREYIKQKHPKVAFIGLGETDEFAHSNRYDQYLYAANKVDKMIAELWYMVQSDPFYKDNTTFIITTDHGRGSKANTWNQHNTFVKGSGEIWMALLGPGIVPIGEMKQQQKNFQKQIAATVAMLLGQTFATDHTVAEAINLPVQAKTEKENAIVVNTRK